MSDKNDKAMDLSEKENQLFTAISENNPVLLKSALAECPNVNILDSDLMTPLQHAAYKGNKEMVQMLLDQGADPNYCKHEHNYTALHFAGLSGNSDCCLILLLAGAKSSTTNTVNRTPAQMAAFVGHHNCVAIINNFVPKSDIERYTVPQGVKTEPELPPYIAESFHKLTMEINLHPVKIAIDTQNFLGLAEHLPEVQKVLQLMSEKEMKKGAENNEVLSFKFHYLGYILGEIQKIKQRLSSNSSSDNQTSTNSDGKSPDVVELFARKLLKPNKDDYLEFMDGFIKEGIREFPFRQSTLFQQIVSALAGKEAPPALNVITSAINGQRGIFDTIPVCYTCNQEHPVKKCSKCKVAQYCDRNCQRLHWHWHKKVCAKWAQKPPTTGMEPKPIPDPGELSEEVKNILISS